MKKARQEADWMERDGGEGKGSENTPARNRCAFCRCFAHTYELNSSLYRHRDRRTHRHTDTHTHTHTHTHTYTRANTYTRVNTHAHACANTPTRLHTQTHTHTHTYTQNVNRMDDLIDG